jgi:hypothetical protein
MWILLRLSFVVFALLYRFWDFRNRTFRFNKEYLGPLEVRVRTSTSRKVTTTEYRISTACRIYFRLSAESKWTRFCKKIGLGVEFQVGDPEFDEVFYVASDHPAFLYSLRDDPALRAWLLELWKMGFTEITSNGTGNLRLKRTEGLVLEPELGVRLLKVRDAIEKIRFTPQLIDRWFLPVLVFETAAWVMGAYGFGSLLHLRFDDGQSVIRPWEIWTLGSTMALLLLAAWMFVVGILLRRSSRTPLLVVDLFFYLFLSVVFAGFQGITDLNHVLDRSKAESYQALILKRYSRTTGTGKSRSTSYYLELRFDRNPESIPEKLRVSSWDYYKLTQGQGVEFRVRKGGLGFAYIDDLIPTPPPEFPADSASPPPVVLSGDQVRNLVSWSASAVPSFGVGVQLWAEVKYASGAFRQREPLVNGMREGSARYWHENGQLYSEIPWVKDQKHGCFILYRPDGTVEQVLSYQSGKPHGLLTWHDDSGGVSRRVLYQDGIPVEVSEAVLKEFESLRPCRPPGTERVDQSTPR